MGKRVCGFCGGDGRGGWYLGLWLCVVCRARLLVALVDTWLAKERMVEA